MQRPPSLPPELDCDVYRRLHVDLAHMGDEALREHYVLHGRSEGRLANGLASREDFAGLVSPALRALEIGPFAKPMLGGPGVVYCDVMDQRGLRQRAAEVGLDPLNVPLISHVLGPHGLDGIPEDFDAVLSSHSIEHQPDLVCHLQQVERRLEGRRGRYFLLVPDKRYCFDRFIAPSTIADVLDAHHAGCKVHSLRSIVQHRALTTHNDAVAHWRGEEKRPSVDPELVARAVAEWGAAGDAYVDVHAWYFTPDTFAEIVGLLNRLGLIHLGVERLYPTRYGAGEFWAILSWQDAEVTPSTERR